METKNDKTGSFIKRSIKLLLVLLTFILSTQLNAQDKYKSSDVKLVVNGTSNIHDWKMQGSKGTTSATFLIQNKVIKALGFLYFSFPAENLKSEHKLMDKNCYKALKTEQHSSINFLGTSSTIKQVNATTFIIVTKGKLQISEVTKEVELTSTCIMNADNTITCKGSTKVKMTDYNVEPPSVMMGSIVTGDEVTIDYTLTLSK
ncbi:MAG: YceI family protein [Bacteroidia bacterium]